MDEGDGLSPEAVKEFRKATDLALRATKHTVRAVGRSMAGSVAAERHLWLNLTEIREKEKVFLLDAPISQTGLFGEASLSRILTRQGQTVQTFLPTSITLSSRRSVTSAQQVSVCSERPSSVSFNVAVGRRIKLSPPTSCSFVTRGSRDRRHFRFSPTAFGHRGLHQPNQGHHRLSFVVDDITPSRPSRHPNSDTSTRRILMSLQTGFL
ncbi:uncharacterized protein LOC131539214 [Onychostoma macrolepis]|uniref:uncharacterized protein LOC131539214 n=1 Tax=Onychostoma macrolepis TaxID=369639 RepID=UPI00272ADA25|nr:uncharacterized protein LOC131539214 [Onychostoma macrolepis]